MPANLTLTTKEEQAVNLSEARDESVAKQTELFWVATLTDEILTLVTELFRSREMVSEYDRLGAQQRLTSEEASCLSDEKSRRDRVQKNLRYKLLLSIEGGATFFRGVQTDATTLGKTLTEALHGSLDRAVPDDVVNFEDEGVPLVGLVLVLQVGRHILLRLATLAEPQGFLGHGHVALADGPAVIHILLDGVASHLDRHALARQPRFFRFKECHKHIRLSGSEA